MAANVPLIGPELARYLHGREDVAGATLSRFFALHVAALPALTTMLLLGHLLLVQQHGISAPPWVAITTGFERPREPEAGPSARKPVDPRPWRVGRQLR